MGDFGSASYSEFAFAKRLSRLNLNIVHLCLSQGLDPKQLKATEALYNLSTFLKEVGEGRVGHTSKPYKLDLLADMSVQICSELNKLEPDDDLSDNEEDSMRGWEEWESVPADMMIVNPYLQHMPSSPSPPPPTAMSMTAGSFMSSLIRGFTSPTGTPSSPQK